MLLEANIMHIVKKKSILLGSVTPEAEQRPPAQFDTGYRIIVGPI